MPKPTLGRIVHYRPTEIEQRGCSENRKAIVRADLPAIITAVNEDGSVNLKAFQDSPIDLHVTNATQGDSAGQWNWPSKTTHPEDLSEILGVNLESLDGEKTEVFQTGNTEPVATITSEADKPGKAK